MNVITEEYRGGILENKHLGRIAVVDYSGEVAYGYGDVEEMTYYRSASKPIQAMAALSEGVIAEADFSLSEIAMLAGSHVGEDYHIQTVLSMLSKGNLLEEELIMLPAYPQITADRDKMIREGTPPRKLIHNCSAKHIALMLLSRRLTGAVKGYHEVENLAEQRVREVMAYMSGVKTEDVDIGIDGCGVPVFAVPLSGIARAYLKLACPELIEDEKLRESAVLMDEAMHSYPLNVRGTGYICSEINRDPNIIGKGGAMGVYGFALKEEKLGIAFKVEDGSEGSWPFVIADVLRQLSYKNEATINSLEALGNKFLKNDNGTVIGEIKSSFKLIRRK